MSLGSLANRKERSKKVRVAFLAPATTSSYRVESRMEMAVRTDGNEVVDLRRHEERAYANDRAMAVRTRRTEEPGIT